MFTFTPLLGAQSASPALQSLLEFDGGIKVLIDVGWDSTFDGEALKELERQVPTISIILLTHATLSHVGAYAHCCKHVSLFSRIPVYATTPVISLSRTLLQDLYSSTPLASSFLQSSSIAETSYDGSSAISTATNILLPPPSSEEINEYFTLANQLKYLQPHQPIPSPFSPSLDGLTIEAYCAGHSLGGTIWHIQYGSESIVYAVDWHQARENVFPGAAWLSGTTGAEIADNLRQPTALICSSKGANAVSVARQQRDEHLLSSIRATIQQGGNVLIPCDSSARVLELAYFLDRAWMSERTPNADTSLRKSKLYFASSTASATIRYARSMPEFMDDNIIREFEAASSAQTVQAKATQPFDFKFLKLLERKSQIDRALSHNGCKVFVASDSTVEWGLSRHLLEAFAEGPSNLVVLTEPSQVEESSEVSVSARLRTLLAKRLEAGKGPHVVQLQEDSISASKVEVTQLTAIDLPVYQQYLTRQRQRQQGAAEKDATTIETSADVIDEQSESSSSSEDESDTEQQGKSMNISAALTGSKNKLGLTDEELGINVLLRRKNVHDFDVRGKKGRDKLFPFVAKRRRHDDFGDVIRPEEYLRAEERDEVDGQDMAATTTKSKAALGHKRKWGDHETGQGDSKRRRQSLTQNQKRRKGETPAPTSKTTNGDVSDTEMSEDESDYEPAEAVVRGPIRAKVTTTHIKLMMKLTGIDYTGMHDRRSLQMLIPLIKPRKLILVGGSARDTSSLATTCRQVLSSATQDSSKEASEVVFTPHNGETIDASVDTNAWTIKLSQDLFRKLQWQNIRSLGIVTINGRLELVQQPDDPQDHDAKRQKTDDAESEMAEIPQGKPVARPAPVLSDLPVNLIGSTRTTNQPLHVGDLRLAELRRIMQSNGHTAEFKGEGTLLVDSIIAVRKSGIGIIEIEGGGSAMANPSVTKVPGASFDLVRRRIYQGLASVAAR